MEFPEYSKWYKVPDNSNARGFAVRRYLKVDGKTKWQRYPAKKLKGMTDDEVSTLINQLNATHSSIIAARDERFNYTLAFINQHSLTRFESFLASQSNDPAHVRAMLSYLNDHVFAFFIQHKKITDPWQWHLASVEWGNWLIAKGLGPRTIKQIVAVANRFTNFLQEKVYTEMPLARKLEPIGRTKLKRMLLNYPSAGKFIDDDAWKKCVDWFKRNDPDVLPNLLLSEWYGLRLSESQGLSKSKFFNSYLLISEQGDKLSLNKIVLKPTKTSDTRKVPHWNVDPKKAWEQVKLIKVMHPDTLNRRINEGLRVFGFGSHDMRRRFITKALRKYNPREVQQAAGHKSIMTTMGYAQDDRQMQDQMMDLD